jgi:ferritin-like metal-binding protein YciE
VRWTLAELDAWRGREALDAEAQPVGRIVSTFVSQESGKPRWLAVETGAHGHEVTPVPIEGAEPTGGAIRFPHPADTILAAPHLNGADLAAEQDRQLVAFYGLEEPPPPRPQPPGAGPRPSPAVIDALRAAHALEREAHSRLQSLISTLGDVELQHDAARHLTETDGHAAAIAGRLEQLEAAPSGLRDMLGMATAKGVSLVSRSVTGSRTAHLLRDALGFERRECGFYDELAATARGAGDSATEAIAVRIRADEEAMAETLAGALRRMGQPVS